MVAAEQITRKMGYVYPRFQPRKSAPLNLPGNSIPADEEAHIFTHHRNAGGIRGHENINFSTCTFEHIHFYNTEASLSWFDKAHYNNVKAHLEVFQETLPGLPPAQHIEHVNELKRGACLRYVSSTS